MRRYLLSSPASIQMSVAMHRDPRGSHARRRRNTRKSSAGVPTDADAPAVNVPAEFGRRSNVDATRISIKRFPSKNSPFHVLHQVLSLRVAWRGRSLGGVVAIAAVVVVGVIIILEVGEVPRVAGVGVGRRRRDGELVVLRSVSLLSSLLSGGG